MNSPLYSTSILIYSSKFHTSFQILLNIYISNYFVLYLCYLEAVISFSNQFVLNVWLFYFLVSAVSGFVQFFIRVKLAKRTINSISRLSLHIITDKKFMQNGQHRCQKMIREISNFHFEKFKGLKFLNYFQSCHYLLENLVCRRTLPSR